MPTSQTHNSGQLHWTATKASGLGIPADAPFDNGPIQSRRNNKYIVRPTSLPAGLHIVGEPSALQTPHGENPVANVLGT